MVPRTLREGAGVGKRPEPIEKGGQTTFQCNLLLSGMADLSKAPPFFPATCTPTHPYGPPLSTSALPRPRAPRTHTSGAPPSSVTLRPTSRGFRSFPVTGGTRGDDRGRWALPRRSEASHPKLQTWELTRTQKSSAEKNN